MTSGRASARSGTSSAVRIVVTPGASSACSRQLSLCSDPSAGTPKSASSSAWSRKPASRNAGLIALHLLGIDRAGQLFRVNAADCARRARTVPACGQPAPASSIWPVLAWAAASMR